MVQPILVSRRVLQVHRGEVDRWLFHAQGENFPEIEERDDVPSGTFREHIEPIIQRAAPDWGALYAQAPTVVAKLGVLARMLNLEV